MGPASHLRRTATRLLAVIVALVLVASACTDDTKPAAKPTKASKPTVTRACGAFRIAYAPDNGYEASAFLVGELASEELGCEVSYVRSSSRNAWRLVAQAKADVYLDAFGNVDLQELFTQPGGPITMLGGTGIRGGVDLLAPEFMGIRGLSTARDLANVAEIGWERATPAVTTVPELEALATAMVDALELDYLVRVEGSAINGMRSLYSRPRADDANGTPAVYLVQGPRKFLGAAPGRVSVDVPESSARGCVPAPESTLCSLNDFTYSKIANTAFAQSGSPAAALVYNYHLTPADADNILEIVALSGYEVHRQDVSAWINTHEDAWKAWIP